MTFYIPTPDDVAEGRTPVRIILCPHCGHHGVSVRSSRGAVKVLACSRCGGTWQDTTPTMRVLVAPINADRVFRDDS